MKKKRNKVKKSDRLATVFMVGPTAIWLLLFLLIPLIYVIIMSFLTKGAFGGIVNQFSIDSYKRILDPLYLSVMGKSVVLAFETSLICLLISYPFAWLLCKMPSKVRGMLSLLIMLPFWVNGLIRLNGWANILRDSGFINEILMKTGLIDEPIQMMYTEGAVLFGMVYTFFPFMVLPLQSSISKLDQSLIEASYDLGAKKVKTFFQGYISDDASRNICRNNTGIYSKSWRFLHSGCYGGRKLGISWKPNPKSVPCSQKLAAGCSILGIAHYLHACCT